MAQEPWEDDVHDNTGGGTRRLDGRGGNYVPGRTGSPVLEINYFALILSTELYAEFADEDLWMALTL